MVEHLPRNEKVGRSSRLGSSRVRRREKLWVLLKAGGLALNEENACSSHAPTTSLNVFVQQGVFMSNNLDETVKNTLSFYESGAEDYFRKTKDLAINLSPFLRSIPKGGLILDAGCGSGRDTLKFLRMGYRVEAFDASSGLAKLASDYTGIPVKVCRFQDFVPNKETLYDGVFASASLLHVPPEELPKVLKVLIGSLRPGGTFWATFKYGPEVTVDGNGRLFNNMTEQTFRKSFRGIPHINSLTATIEGGSSSGGESTKWLNVCATTKERIPCREGLDKEF